MSMGRWDRILVIFAVGALIGCTSDAPNENGSPENHVEIQMPYEQKNIQVPRELWKKIKKILIADEVPEDIQNNFAIYPTKISVELMNYDVGVLKENRNYTIQFPEGGGTLDLFDYVSGKGAFAIRLAPSLMNDSPFHMLYISDSPGRVVSGDKWGNGCGHIFDLSSKSEALLAGDGIRVTTGKRHYMHLLAGSYVFFQMVEDRMLLGYIQLTDSRFPQFSCSP